MDIQVAAVIASNPKLERLMIARREAFLESRHIEYNDLIDSIIKMWKRVGVEGVTSGTAYGDWLVYYRKHGALCDG